MSLRLVIAAALAANAVAAAVSIDRGLPAEWGTVFHGDPDDVLGDFLTWRGTAIAPPLAMMVALAALAYLVPRHRLAVWAVALIAAAGIVGYLGEPAAWELDPVTTPLVGLGVALYALMLGLAAAELRGERRLAVAA